MKITVYGTRGSYPVCINDVMRYGGNTTCMLVEEKEDFIVIDGGSGIFNLGKKIVDDNKNYTKNINILVTHTHWDHVMVFLFLSLFIIQIII